MGDTSKSETWRERAAEYRAYADDAKTIQGRTSFTDLADRCEQIAGQVDRLEEAEGVAMQQRDKRP